MQTLVSGVEGKLDNALRAMGSCAWGTWESVGEESQYVHLTHDGLKAGSRCVQNTNTIDVPVICRGAFLLFARPSPTFTSVASATR
jgi:hypothetical protein